MKITKTQLKRIIKEELKRAMNESMYQTFSRGWASQNAWKMVSPKSIISVYKGIRSNDPEAFINDLPHEWQKPKVRQALQDAGILKGTPAPEPAAPTTGASYEYSGPDPSKAKKTSEFRMDPRTGEVSE